MNKIRVGVLRGGAGHTYHESLNTGLEVLRNLPEKKYDPVDILVTKDGQWYTGGLPTTLQKLSRKVDVMFNALHGEYGEDGKVQRELESWKIPYTGSKVFGSALGAHRAFAREHLRQAGLKVPRGRWIRREDMDEYRDKSNAPLCFEIFRELTPPWTVKPVFSGSPFPAVVARSFPDLQAALASAIEADMPVIVEEHVRGTEAVCVVADGFRGEDTYTFLPLEIQYRKQGDSTEVREIIPGRFSRVESAFLQEAARRVHRTLGLRHYSRSDFTVTPRGIYALHATALPALGKESPISHALGVVGSSLPEFLDHVVGLAVARK
ncbi:MAG: hypothetical protein PHS95_03370 [Candidatus Pacebacteria bacterium]|nr:hypothetical protein [Candidatus Paceibacterota bacterium]